MFKSLRNKFLILGMSITSLVLVTAFSIIYIMTYESIQQENTAKLNEAAANPFMPLLPNISVIIPTDYRPSFTLYLDLEGNLVDKNSFINMSEDDYTEAAQKVWSSGDAPIQVSGRLWQYSRDNIGYYFTSTIHGVTKDDSESEGTTLDISSTGMALYQYTFLDVTESHQTLQKLLFTFLTVGIATLIIVFVTSMFFANNAIKPIKLAWEAQKQFIADASHELKTPITIINSNYGALVSKRNETIDSQMKWLNYIKDGADRMDKLIGKLLYLAKTESAENSLGISPVNISRLVSNELHSMESTASEKGLTITQAIEPELIINSDSEKLAQIVGILLDNAIKYSDACGSIDITLKKEKSHEVTFSVKNTGCGIKKEDLPKIFDRFYRVDASRTHNGGYGLGLSIAKAILDSIGGKICATSIEGESTTFTVTL